MTVPQTLLRRIDPRLHLSAAIGWAVFAVVSLAALAAAYLAASEAEGRARAAAQALLGEFATQVRDALSLQIEARRSLLLATAAQLGSLSDRSPSAQLRVLEAAQVQVPEFAWMGVADDNGQLLVSTEDISLAAQPAPQAPWFEMGRRQPVVDDRRALPTADAQGLRLVELAAPLAPGLERGDGVVLVATLPWSWVEAQINRMQQALDARRQIEVLIASRDGTLLVAPKPWLGQRLGPESDLTESGAYEVATRAQLRMAEGVGLGWTATVRRSAEVTLAPVHETRRAVFVIVFSAGLLAAAVAVLVTRALTSRLSQLARQAEAVRRGERGTLEPTPGADEVARIGAALAEAVGHLQAEKQSLQALNQQLDLRVAERTERIERLAEETRHAAVTRERLRLARDLHDTLAHSLMALLTQIRLVRKLKSRMRDDELDGELARAEGVATSGLRDARAAIAQMRDNGVRDAGIGPALHDLVRRFQERTGTAVDLRVDSTTSTWADERAETLFRIAEEALRNVERHAQARQVRISLGASPAAAAGESLAVRLEVADDGQGFDTAQAPVGHFGLLGMQEQAALVAARFVLQSQAGQGTRITVDLVA
jgi:signal transduction histidine kinase